jgi:hypothetical protein
MQLGKKSKLDNGGDEEHMGDTQPVAAATVTAGNARKRIQKSEPNISRPLLSLSLGAH